MPKSLIREVADYCWSNNFLKIFRQFFTDHAEAFENAPEISSGEHNLEYYNLFQIYLGLYEETLTEYLSKLDCSIEEFYQDVRDAKADETDPYLLVFIDCLLASADYDSFYKVMYKQGLLSKAKKSSGGFQEIRIASDFKATSAADSKSSVSPAERSLRDAKGGLDEDSEIGSYKSEGKDSK